MFEAMVGIVMRSVDLGKDLSRRREVVDSKERAPKRRAISGPRGVTLCRLLPEPLIPWDLHIYTTPRRGSLFVRPRAPATRWKT